MHTQMLSFEDSTIRDAVFPDEVGKEEERRNEQARGSCGVGGDRLGR